MRNKLLSDLTAAMKAQDKETLSVLRMVKGAIQLEEINLKHELNDDEFTTVVGRQIKTRHTAHPRLFRCRGQRPLRTQRKSRYRSTRNRRSAPALLCCRPG